MKIAKESIFITAVRTFFNTLLGTLGVFIAFIPSFILFSIFTPSEHKEGVKNKIEILPDLNGNTKMLSLNSPVILQLEIHGVIGKSPLTSNDMMYQLIESRKGLLKNNRVKAIFLHINSPGGAATDSDDIYRNLIAYKEKYNVPIFAFVDGMCASGGFYIACASEKIFATPMSMIGSVGSRLGPFFNVSKFLDNYGVDSSTITAGKDKDMMNPFRPWKKDEDESLENLNKYIYNRFVTIVSESRNIDKNKIINDFGAKVFDNEKAKEIGYIDTPNSSYDEALEALLDKANIDKTKTYQVITLYPKKNWFYPFASQTRSFIESILKDILYTNTTDANNLSL